MSRVLVIGAGPAGLAAGVRLLEEGRGRVEVKLIHMGHHLGGKAASHRAPDGRFVEHGWHMVVGFYERMRSLMARAGISRSVLRTMGGQSHPYESFTGRIHTLDSSGGRLRFATSFALTYDGLPVGDRFNLSRVLSEAYSVALSREPLSAHDDVCFDTWAVERGLRPHAAHYSLFRFFREAYFNFPEQVSAYHVLQTLRLMNDSPSSELFVVDGPYSERVWDPIGAYFERLGGEREPYCMATDLLYEGRRIVGVRAGRPEGRGHQDGRSSWQTPRLPVAEGSERTLEGFDCVISTVPHAVFLSLNAGDARWWNAPYFSRLKNLRSATTVSMVVETERPALPFPGPVFGFRAPMGIAVNMTPYWDERRAANPNGSVVAFVGQEAGFEHVTDEALSARTLDELALVPEGDLRAAGIRYLELHRNRSDFERLLLCEPGVQQFRPGPRTPFKNLFLAGDWVRNPVDLICMEGAIVAGEQAADLVLEEVARGA